MNQPPGGPPDDERPGFEPPYVQRPSVWPPMGPPGGQPYVPPPESRLKPPWRTAEPGEKGKYVGYTLIGFFVPWALVALAVLFVIYAAFWSGEDVNVVASWAVLALLVIDVVINLTGTVLAFAAPSRTVRSLGWGALIALITQIIVFALGIVVVFGWCVSTI